LVSKIDKVHHPKIYPKEIEVEKRKHEALVAEHESAIVLVMNNFLLGKNTDYATAMETTRPR